MRVCLCAILVHEMSMDKKKFTKFLRCQQKAKTDSNKKWQWKAVPKSNHATKVLHRCQKPPNCNFASVSIWPNSQRGSIWAEKIYSEIWTNMFCTLENFFFAFLKNAFWNSTQLLLQLCLCLHLTKFLASLTKLGLKKLQTLQKPISFCILSCTQHQASIGFVFLCPHFYAHIYFFLHNSPCSASK